MIVRLRRVRLLPEKRQELDLLLRDVVKAIAGEEGTLSFCACLSRGTPETLVIFEAYRDEDALAQHQKNPVFEQLRPRLQGILADAPEDEMLSPIVGKGFPVQFD